mgnify:CR=1 FL=1
MLLAQRAHSNGAFIRFAHADDQQVRNLRQRMLAHLVVDLLVTDVGLGAETLELTVPVTGRMIHALDGRLDRDEQLRALAACERFGSETNLWARQTVLFDLSTHTDLLHARLQLLTSPGDSNADQLVRAAAHWQLQELLQQQEVVY